MNSTVRVLVVMRLMRFLGLIALGISQTANAANESPAADVANIAVRAVPSPLLAIDRNRNTVIDRIVGEWGDALVKSNAGIDAEQLRALLTAMRADQLLAASLAGSLEGLRNVVASALVSEADVKPSLLHAKALGDANQDVVYVPVTPCRLVETRGTFAAVYQGGGPFAPTELRTYTLQGGNGVCLTQLPASVSPSAIQLQVFGIPTTTGSGDIEILPQGAAFGNTATLVYLGNTVVTSAAATSLVNLANKQIGVQVRGGGAHVAIDVVGYFRAPAGGYVNSITAGTGLTGGTITSSGTIAADTTYLQRRVSSTCGAGSSIRTINPDGTVVCETDDVGAGTVTSVGTGTGLTGGPITTTGTVSIAPGGVDAAQLANGAVTQGKLSATGTSRQILSTDGTNLVWLSEPNISRWSGQIGSILGASGAFVFAGPTASVVVPSSIRRVTATASGAMAVTSGSPAANAEVNICYQQGAGAVSEFQFGTYMAATFTTNRAIYTASDSVVLGVGTFNVGLCVRNTSAFAITSNDWSKGWAIVTLN